MAKKRKQIDIELLIINYVNCVKKYNKEEYVIIEMHTYILFIKIQKIKNN